MPISALTREDHDRLLADRHYSNHLFPELTNVFMLEPCEIGILMVTDRSGGFADQDFSLRELIDVLTTSIGGYARPVISTAHRDFTLESDFDKFRFDEHNLSNYDQIWLFGVERTINPLSQSELRALATFMDAGGGVFATGDHEDLGLAMCGSVPRVRSMRRWHWPNPGPLGEPAAPNGDGPDRLDTMVRREDFTLTGLSQSDYVPQPIQPKMYTRRVNAFEISYPHPVLCGPNGPIRVMPDHPHEGECYETTDRNRTLRFDGQDFVEYPNPPGALRPLPEVIAFSTHGSRREGDHKGVLNPKTFGGIAVYDGHKAEVGRVLVDSTWHHFFNMNLIGRNGALSPSDEGFKYNAEGLAAYEEIKAYFRNIVIYLAPPGCQARMRFLAAYWARWNNQISTEFRPYHLNELNDRDRIFEFRRLGELAKDLYGQYASRCQSMIWAWDWLDMLRPYPWSPFMQERGGLNSKMVVEFEQDIEATIHGAVLYAIEERYPRRITKEVRDKIEIDRLSAELSDVAKATTRKATGVYARELTRGRRELSRAMRALG